MDHIKIADSSPITHHIADGVSTRFTFPFPIFKAEDLAVYVNKTRTCDFSVCGAGVSDGGTITLAAPPVAGAIVTLWRRLPVQRLSDFNEGGAFLNDDLDKIIAMIQQVAEAGGRALSVSPYVVTPPDMTLPEPVAGRSLKWDDLGGKLINSTIAVDEVLPEPVAGRSLKWDDAGNLINSTIAVDEVLPEPVTGRSLKWDAAGKLINSTIAVDEVLPEPVAGRSLKWDDAGNLINSTIAVDEVLPEPVAGRSLKWDAAGNLINSTIAVDEVLPEPVTGRSLKWDAAGNLINSTIAVDEVLPEPVTGRSLKWDAAGNLINSTIAVDEVLPEPVTGRSLKWDAAGNLVNSTIAVDEVLPEPLTGRSLKWDDAGNLINSTIAVDEVLPEPVTGRSLKWDDAGNLINSTIAVDEITAAEVSFTGRGSAVSRTVESRLQDRSSVLDFIPVELHVGIRDGSNTTDLTTYLQNAFDNSAGYFPFGVYRISAGLTFSGHVICMEEGAYIAPYGSGYTALTITTQGLSTSGWDIAIRKVEAPAFAGNGIYWNGMGYANIGSLKVHNCDGFGVKLANMWGSHIASIYVSQCGNADNYAFSIEDGDDYSYMNVIDYIDVRVSNTKAIYISRKSRKIVFSNIQSYHNIAVDGVQSHELSGALCCYHNIYVENESDSGYGLINMNVAESQVHNLFVASNIPVTISAGINLAACFINCQFSGPVSTYPDQLGNFNFQRCRFTDLSMATGGNGWLVQDCDITGTLSVGFITYATITTLSDIRAYAMRRHFSNCRIANLASSSDSAAASFYNCILSLSSPVLYWTIFDGCNITGTVTCITSNYLEMRASVLVGNLVGGYQAQGWISNSDITGVLVSDGSGHQPFVFDNVRGSGSIPALFSAPPNRGVWVQGQSCDRLPPAVGSPQGWVYDGTTWLARPNL